MASFYWINAKGDQTGPIDAANAVGLVKTGMITAETLVWTEGMANWAAAKTAPVLGDYFRVPSPPPPPAGGRPPADASFVQSVHTGPLRASKLLSGHRRRGRAAKRSRRLGPVLAHRRHGDRQSADHPIAVGSDDVQSLPRGDH